MWQIYRLSPGLLIRDRFRLVQRLGAGSSGSTWLARDTIANTDVVVKFFAKRTSVQDEYYLHLARLHEILGKVPLAKWVGPVEVGELGEFGYQVLPYLEGYASLDDILAKRNADSSLRKVIRLIAEIADALDGLHAAGVIHADVKPSNILVAPDQNQIRLIDFGMIRKVENSNAVELVSTWRYLHPVFTEGASKQRDQMHSRRVSVDLKVPTGAYVDMYALGIIALELLTNQTAYVRPATERSIDDVISTHNKAFLAQSISLRGRISNLVLQLLSVNPSRETISARTIASIAESILLEIPADGQLADAPLIVDGHTAQPSPFHPLRRRRQSSR